MLNTMNVPHSVPSVQRVERDPQKEFCVEVRESKGLIFPGNCEENLIFYSLILKSLFYMSVIAVEGAVGVVVYRQTLGR